MTRARRRLAIAALAVLAAAACCFVWGFLIEPGRIAVRDHRLRVPGWPAGLDGVRIAALADVHEGAPFVTPQRVRALVDEVNARQPDMIVLLGDYLVHGVVGGRRQPPEQVAADLAGLRAPHGVFAVFGNHDVWFDARRVRAAFESRGITFLADESRAVELRPGQVIHVVGLREVGTQRLDQRRAFAGVPPGGKALVLTHNPDVFPLLAGSPAVLTLAGHTHGGQVRLPLFGPPWVPSEYGARYAGGLVVEDGRAMFVSTGIGTSILPVRFGVPPEVSLLEIHP